MLTMLTSNADFVWDSLRNFAGSTGIAGFFSEMGWGSVAMICVAFFLLYLAIRHKFEPLLLFTIAFGMLLTNLPGANLYHTELFADGHVHWDIFVANAGLLDYLYLGVKLGIYPCLIFVGVGAMTDFGPLIATRRASCSAPPRRSASSRRSSALTPWASRPPRPVPSVSSAVRTARRPSTSPRCSPPNCWARSLWRLIPTWRSCR